MYVYKGQHSMTKDNLCHFEKISSIKDVMFILVQDVAKSYYLWIIENEKGWIDEFIERDLNLFILSHDRYSLGKRSSRRVKCTREKLNWRREDKMER